MNAPKPLDLAGVRRRQQHLFFLLDCSGSMAGESIRALNAALRAAIPAMRKAAESHVEVDLLVRAIRFADEARWHIAAPVPVRDLGWADVAAAGRTALGGALRLLAGQLTAGGMPGPQLRPICILVSDGKPTDDFAAGLCVLDAAPYGARAIRIAIAVGDDADADALARFTGASAFRPRRARDPAEIAAHVRWASTAAIGAAGRPRCLGGAIAAS